MEPIPDKFYYWIGASIVTSFSTICALIWLGFKMTWVLAERFTKLDARDNAIDNKADLAHSRVDKIENKVWK